MSILPHPPAPWERPVSRFVSLQTLAVRGGCSAPLQFFNRPHARRVSHAAPRSDAATEAASAPSSSAYQPLVGRFTSKQIKNLPLDRVKFELSLRGLPTLGFSMQLSSRLYQALFQEGMAISGEEAMTIDIDLPDVDADDESGIAAAYADDPLLAHQVTRTGKLLQEESTSVMSNKTGVQATFMYTQIAPNGLRASTSLAVRSLQSVWLFECGEDTQRALLGHPLVDWKRIDRVFISSMNPEAVLGVPGMLCTISASRERGHENADFPVHVYGPPGLVSFVSTMLSVSRTYLEMPVVLHEFTPRAVPASQLGQVSEVLRRARLYAVRVPPDQLNPDGYHDGHIAAMLDRHTRKRSTSNSDPRAAALPHPLPPPGDPALADSLPVTEMTWTVLLDTEWRIKAVPLKGKGPCLGYILQEADRSGRLYPAVATALGVMDREQFAALKEGKEVVAGDGSVVRPEMCCGPVRRGRSLAVVPPCMDSLGFAAAVGDKADLVVHSLVPPEGSLPEEGPERMAAMAGECSAALGASELVLWQPLTSFLDLAESADRSLPLRALDAARAAFGDDHVTLGGSFRAHQWERDDGHAPPPEMPPHVAHLLLPPEEHERRVKTGRCVSCGEPWTPEHKCAGAEAK